METPKKLYRPKKNRIIAGVCAGLANYFNIDPWIVRLVFLALLFADGVAALIYIILIFVIPEEPADAAEIINTAEKPVTNWLANRKNVFAFILIGLGIIFLLKQIVPWTWFNANLFWPLVIVAVGIWLIIKK